MILGAHESVAGGLHKALERGGVDGCGAVQVFTKNGSQWREPPLLGDAVRAFRDARGGIATVLAHTSYLINLATDKEDILQRSKDALVAEIERCSTLGIEHCVLHPGAHLGAGEDAALFQVARALDEVHARTKGASCTILLENTAGQGSCIGCRFEHLASLFAQVKDPARLGVCFDTQHAFAAGYDLATPEGYEATFAELDRVVGLDRVRAFHLNDSKKALGSRIDRHEHVGEGLLGRRFFWRLVNDPRFARVPGVIEIEPRSEDTPYKEDVDLLKSLVGASEPAPPPSPNAPLETFALELAPGPGPGPGRATAAPKRKRR